MADVEKIVARALAGCCLAGTATQEAAHRALSALKEAGYVVVRESEVVPISRDGKSVFIDGTGEVPLDFGESDNDT